MSTSTYAIVGAFYRPPAKALLEVLQVGTPLTLKAEPDNPADPNAIAVWLEASNIGEAGLASLEEKLSTYGFTVSNIIDTEWWHVGYIPRELAAKLRNGGFGADMEYPGAFTCSPRGAPMVRIEDPAHA